MRRIAALFGLIVAACTMAPIAPAAAQTASVVHDTSVALAAPMTIRASSRQAMPQTITVDSTSRSSRSPAGPISLFSLVGVALMGITANKVAGDKNTYFPSDTVRQQHNLLVSDFLWAKRNYMIGTNGTPGATTATTTTKAKTANTVNYVRGGVVRASLTAQDNFWDLTTAGQGTTVVPASSTIKYWLAVTAAEAAKVYSSPVGASGSTPVFPAGPADGDVILAVLQITTDSSHTFTPGTTALGAAGITSTFTDGTDGSEIMSNQVTP